MRGFLRFVGVIELIGYFCGIIAWFFVLPFAGWNILYFIIYLVFGPALACLFFSVASLIDDKEQLKTKVEKLEKTVAALKKEVCPSPDKLDEKQEKPAESLKPVNVMPSASAEPRKKVNCSVGDMVKLVSDSTVSSTDSRKLSAEAKGKVVNLTKNYAVIEFKIDGDTVISAQDRTNVVKL